MTVGITFIVSSTAYRSKGLSGFFSELRKVGANPNLNGIYRPKINNTLQSQRIIKNEDCCELNPHKLERFSLFEIRIGQAAERRVFAQIQLHGFRSLL